MRNYQKLNEAKALLSQAYRTECKAIEFMPKAIRKKLNKYFLDILERHAWIEEEISKELMILEMKSPSQHEKYYPKKGKVRL